MFYVSIALTLMVFIFFGMPIGICTFLLTMFMDLHSMSLYNVFEVIAFPVLTAVPIPLFTLSLALLGTAGCNVRV